MYTYTQFLYLAAISSSMLELLCAAKPFSRCSWALILATVPIISLKSTRSLAPIRLALIYRVTT